MTYYFNRSKLNSRDRKNSQKRLGISSNLHKKKLPPPSSVDEEKKRIQTFLDSFFQSEANAGKFSDAEKWKFSQNFKKAFIEGQLGSNPVPLKNAGPKLKALPAPPVIKSNEEKPPLRAILPTMPQREEKKVIDRPCEDPTDQKLGNVKFYSNAFSNNFNFLTKNSIESDSQFDVKSNLKETEEVDSRYMPKNAVFAERPNNEYQPKVEEEFFSPDTEEK